MAVEVIGRGDELRFLHAFLEQHAADEGLVALALEGEPGIGKSTLWHAAVEAARERGWRVLSSRPAESERTLAHAGLGDLFEGVLAEVLPALSAPRRRALEVALLVEDAASPVDPRTLGVAVRAALDLLAEQKLLIAIDDLQWLDGSSASALGFALRRLSEANVMLAWTRRPEGEQSAVESALDPDRIHHVGIGPLSAGAIQGIVRDRLSRPLARPTLVRLHELSGGNPFYALELARALGPDGRVEDPTLPLPVPERLEELVSARLRGFSGATHEALVLASADARLTPAQLRDAGIKPSALDPALDEDVVELADGAVRFTHPLLASVLYQGLSTGERHRAHRRLADLADDPVVRARHLALSTNVPDAGLAAALEQASTAATAHGAPIAAAELGEHAVRLTPAENGADLVRRTAATARAHHAAGDAERARALATELLGRASAGAERAEALALLALVAEESQTAIRLLREALSEPGAPPALRASIHRWLSGVVRMSEGLAAAERHARASLELAERLGDDALRAAAMGPLALIRFNAAQPGALRLAERAYSVASNLGDREAVAETGFALAHIRVWSVHLDDARELLETVHRTWSDRDEIRAAEALWYLALVELRAGRLALAGAYAEDASRLREQYARDEAEFPAIPYPLALVAINRGELERGRDLAARMGRLAEVHGMRLREPAVLTAVAELWGGNPQAAVARFADAERVEVTNDVAEPSMGWWRPEQVEALLEVGLVGDAVERLDAWEAEGRRVGRDWVVAHATRCRGLVAASTGEVELAVSLLADAVSQHEAVGDPLGRARALLALGVAQRRLRQKRAAREAIVRAVAIFAECGAEGWAGKARAELVQIGGRRREEGLTPAETRVAALVAEGRTNREVAAALYLSERTVENHLSRAYTKLGVRSRTELARKLGSSSSPAQS